MGVDCTVDIESIDDDNDDGDGDGGDDNDGDASGNKNVFREGGRETGMRFSIQCSLSM